MPNPNTSTPEIGIQNYEGSAAWVQRARDDLRLEVGDSLSADSVLGILEEISTDFKESDLLSSPRESMRVVMALQGGLAHIMGTAILGDYGVDCVYGNGCKRAVQAFQKQWNDLHPEDEIMDNGVLEGETVARLKISLEGLITEKKAEGQATNGELGILDSIVAADNENPELGVLEVPGVDFEHREPIEPLPEESWFRGIKRAWNVMGHADPNVVLNQQLDMFARTSPVVSNMLNAVSLTLTAMIPGYRFIVRNPGWPSVRTIDYTRNENATSQFIMGPGLSTSQDTYVDFVEDLQDRGHEAIKLDYFPEGFWAMVNPQGVEEMADNLVEQYCALGDEGSETAYIGHSMGGVVGALAKRQIETGRTDCEMGPLITIASPLNGSAELASIPGLATGPTRLQSVADLNPDDDIIRSIASVETGLSFVAQGDELLAPSEVMWDNAEEQIEIPGGHFGIIGGPEELQNAVAVKIDEVLRMA